MEYLFIGLLVSIGWHFGGLIFDVIGEVLFERLHKEDWYQVVCKIKPSPKKNEKKELEPYRGTTMGFRITDEL